MTDVRKLGCVLAVLALGCEKRTPPPEQAREKPQAGAQADRVPLAGRTVTDQQKPDESFAREGVTSLDAEYQLEPPRSTGGDLVTGLWQEAKPEAVQPPPLPPAKLAQGQGPPKTHDGDKPPKQLVKHVEPDQPQVQAEGQAQPPPAPPKTPRTWLQPAVLIGRTQVFVAGKPVGKVTCTAEKPELCGADALRGPTGKQALDVDPTVQAAVGAAAQANGWHGKDVVVLMDRRVAWSGVEGVQQALLTIGARPVFAAATYLGQVTRVTPAANAAAAPPPETEPGVAVVATGGESSAQADAVPDDLTGVTVGVTGHGMTLVLARKGGEPAQPELMGNLLEALAAWSERLRAAAPSVQEVTVSIEAQAPVEEVVRAVDALRDTCARVAKGTPCHDRRVLYPRILLTRAGVPAVGEAVPTPDAAPALQLGNPSMRLGELPPSGELRLQGGPTGIIARDRLQMRPTPSSIQSPRAETQPSGQAAPSR